MLPRLELGVHQHIPDRGVEDVVARAPRQPDQALLAGRAVRAAAAQHDRGHQEAVAQRRFQLPWLPGRPADLRRGSMRLVRCVLRDHAGTLFGSPSAGACQCNRINASKLLRSIISDSPPLPWWVANLRQGATGLFSMCAMQRWHLFNIPHHVRPTVE